MDSCIFFCLGETAKKTIASASLSLAEINGLKKSNGAMGLIKYELFYKFKGKDQKMKIYLLVFWYLPMAVCCYAQQIEVEVTQNGVLKSVNIFYANQSDEIIIRLSETGGVNVASVDGAEFEYFTSYELPEKEGKIARIGDTEVDYYVVFESSPLNGKISRIGGVKVDYFDEYATDEKVGKVSSIVGLASVSYHRTFKNDGNYGKLAKIGEHEVRFYDDRIRKGKIAQFGPIRFDYYEFNHDVATRGKIRSVSGEHENITVRIVDMGE